MLNMLVKFTRTFNTRASIHPLKNKNDGHLYIVKEREFIKTNENIFKIGRSQNIVNRMPAYPKDSRIYCIMYTPHLKEDEKRMIKLFDDLFINRTDIGREYYECSENEIMSQFLLFIKDIYK